MALAYRSYLLDWIFIYSKKKKNAWLPLRLWYLRTKEGLIGSGADLHENKYAAM